MDAIVSRLDKQARSALHDLAKTEAGHVDSLDGLRALAAGVVLLCHTYLAPGGYIGVPVFFVLSGYLITGILTREYERTGHIDLHRFLTRRLLRLAPALLLVLAIFSTYDIAREASFNTYSVRVLPWVITYLGNWKQVLDGVHALGLWGHTWSLAVEQQFYLVWPLVLVAVMRWGRGGLAVFAFGMIIAMGALRILYHDPNPAADRATQYAIDTLMLGALLSVGLRDRVVWVRAFAKLWPVAAAYLLGFCFWPDRLGGSSGFGPILGMLSSGALIAALLLNTGPSRPLSSLPFRILGRLSYGVYLWHLPATLALNGHIKNHLLLTAAVTVVSLIGALLSWIFVEQPLMSLRGRSPAAAPQTIAKAAPEAP